MECEGRNTYNNNGSDLKVRGVMSRHGVDFDQLSVPEKILYLQELWDRIAEEPEKIELTDAQREELDRRLDSYQADPSKGSTWEEIRREIQGRGR